MVLCEVSFQNIYLCKKVIVTEKSQENYIKK